MTLGGWIMMISSVGGVSLLTGWCFWRVLRSPHPEEQMHAPLDIDTHDRDT